jgi:hypothetical protein
MHHTTNSGQSHGGRVFTLFLWRGLPILDLA